MKFTEKTITFRLPDPENSDALDDLKSLCNELSCHADDMFDACEYANADPDDTEYTQADYETACQLFSAAFDRLKDMWEGK